jgi:hypothetical protein
METEVELRAAMMAAIGRELRVALADIIADGVPERFAAILSKLDDPSNEPLESRDVNRNGER